MLNPLDSIAVFDSGIGGMTVVQALKQHLPHEPILYFADTASRPFGLKSKDELEAILESNLKKILTHPIKALVIACHTACSNDSTIFDQLHIPVIKITPFTLELVQKTSDKESILVLGTQKTITSGIFQNFLKDNLPAQPSYFINGSPLEKLIEELSTSTDSIFQEIQNLLYPVKRIPIQKVVLACTHFPIYRKFIESELSSKIDILDPAQEFAQIIRRELTKRALLHPTSHKSSDTYFTTGNLDFFKQKLLYYFPEMFKDHPPQINLC